VSHARRIEAADELAVDGYGQLITGHFHQQIVPFADLDGTGHRLLFTFERLLLFVRELLLRLPGGLDVEPHVAGLQILKKNLLRTDPRGEKVSRMHLLALGVGEIQPEAVPRILQHEAQRDRAIGELGRMSDRHCVVRLGMEEDVHRAIAKVHLLVALCAALAVGGPAVARLVGVLLRLVTREIILEYDPAEMFRRDERSQSAEGKEDKGGFHGSEVVRSVDGWIGATGQCLSCLSEAGCTMWTNPASIVTRLEASST
jgi:hypothetical protein